MTAPAVPPPTMMTSKTDRMTHGTLHEVSSPDEQQDPEGDRVVSQRAPRLNLHAFALALLGSRVIVRCHQTVARPLARTPMVVRHRVAVDGMPPALRRFRIVQLSDLHVATRGPTMGYVTSIIERLAPDLVVFTGDFIDGDGDLPRLRAEIGEFRCRCPAFAVLGNHDLWSNGFRPRPNDVAGLMA